MSRRTLILIVVLIGITAVLLAIALTPKQAPVPVKQGPTPGISYAQTTLRINNNPIAVTSTSSAVPLYSTDVTITTGGSKVNAVQLELAFDTIHLYNVDIKPGPLFKNAIELLKKINSETGTISYAIATPLGQKGFSGSGVVAVITFAEKGKPGEIAQINFLPKSLVTAQGIDKSVLKTAVGATFPLSALPSRLNTGTPSAQ
ncbi:MAG: hypothetical protein A3H50_00800 [Candidatus Levybacteria bacterium RIFCSPLOWO2_02_FULL_37_10]|nr:MAG: hypothetical protein A2860_04120 [Candidatus Levybacteria bacterium RIFCSPHIGHO2_01_FULL_37_33]OGH29765.1 MAG: hypothetical protein A3F30_04020 [Candidatus Levybacteria bacterium RIFCSPHIGHO2_12_FULL_37_12]OGH43179.1 MAG: hypothetical protein A3H50_00800 [Candidatus Levybacteria bacterium RIFCSPLOWO2_02_FULL_37_10]